MFFSCFFRYLSCKKGSTKELHTGSSFGDIKTALCGLNLITSCFSKVEFSDASSAPKTLFYYKISINLFKSFRPPFSKGGAGGGARSPSKKSVQRAQEWVNLTESQRGRTLAGGSPLFCLFIVFCSFLGRKER